MVIFGGSVGLILGFFFIGAPLAASLALILGVPVVFPLGSPAVTPSMVVAVIVHAVVVVLLYVIAAIAQTMARLSNPGVQAPQDGLEQFCRGVLVGINAITNFCLLLVLVGGVPVLGQLFALSIGVLNFLAVFEFFSLSVDYAATLG